MASEIPIEIKVAGVRYTLRDRAGPHGGDVGLNGA